MECHKHKLKLIYYIPNTRQGNFSLECLPGSVEKILDLHIVWQKCKVVKKTQNINSDKYGMLLRHLSKCLQVFVHGPCPICLSRSDVRAFKWVYITRHSSGNGKDIVCKF